MAVHPHVTGAERELLGAGRGQAGVDGVVDQQPPDMPEGHVADEFLDVHASVAERAAFLIGLGDLGLERNHAFETRLEVGHQALSFQAQGGSGSQVRQVLGTSLAAVSIETPLITVVIVRQHGKIFIYGQGVDIGHA